MTSQRRIRFFKWPLRRRGSLVVVLAVLPVLALAGAWVLTARSDEATVGVAAEQAPNGTATSTSSPPTSQLSDSERFARRQQLIETSTAPRVAFFGDSSALMSAMGFDDWAVEDDFTTLVQRPGAALLGCGLLPGTGQIIKGVEGHVSGDCDTYVDQWRAAVANTHIDMAVVQFGPWEVLDQRLTPDGRWLAIGRDPELDQALQAKLQSDIDLLREHVSLVVLVVPPDIVAGMVDGQPPAVAFPESDPARMQRFRQIVRDVADQTPNVETVDLQAFLQNRPDQWQIRPDGIHPTPETAHVIGDWLGPELKRLWDTNQASG